MSDILDTIFSSIDIPEKVIEVPEWGGVKILIRGLTVAEHAAVRASTKDEEMAVTAVIEGAYDPGTRRKIFTPVHRDQLRARSPVVLGRIAEAILRLTGETPQSLEAAEKNSQAASSDSSTSSPGNSVVQ